MSEAIYKIDAIFGHTELKQFHKFENGRMVFYSYSIKHDQNGKETSRTEPTSLSSIGWGDGSPFMETDYLAMGFRQ